MKHEKRRIGLALGIFSDTSQCFLSEAPESDSDGLNMSSKGFSIENKRTLETQPPGLMFRPKGRTPSSWGCQVRQAAWRARYLLPS